MLIGIDARELTSGRPGGYRSYVAGLLWGLAEVDSTNRYVIYVDSARLPESVRLPQKSQVKIVPGNRIVQDLVRLRSEISVDSPDLVHFPCNYGLCGLGVPTVITVHDCFFMEEPLRGSPKRQFLNRYTAFMCKRSLQTAAAVVTVSEYSRAEITRKLRPSTNIEVIYPACPPALKSDETEGESDKDAYFLFIASTEPRKNSCLVVKAFARSRAFRDGCKLYAVCSGRAAARKIARTAKEHGVGVAVKILFNVTDTELRALYRSAVAFVFPSLKEGFGLPPLEAMSNSCPVLASRATAIPEVLGEAALYFDPTDEEDLAHNVDQVWQNNDVRAQLIDKGYRQAGRYSWSKAARQVLAVYERTVAAG